MSSEFKSSDRNASMKEEAFSELLRIKDEITTKLLEETKKSADLAQIQSSVEEQLRTAFEKTLQNVRTEFVKKRKKIIPGVKQLEVASTSLSKAERNLQQYPRKSNSEIKKSKRRIKYARQILMECTSVTSELYSNLQRCVSDEISVFREKLLDIPESMHKSLIKLQSLKAQKDKYSDSDSDMSLDGSLNMSKEETIKFTDSKNDITDTYSTMNDKSGNARVDHPPFQRNKTRTALNGVDLFTSDSDSLEEKYDTGTYQPIGPFLMSQDIDPKRSDIKKVPTIRQHILNEGTENQLLHDGHNTHKTTRLSRRDQVQVMPSPRSSQKRCLPSLPTKSFSDQVPNISKRSTDNKFSKTPPETLPFSTKPVNGSAGFHTLDIEESLDMEEIEFKETVKNTRQQIIDKLKSKCTPSPTYKFMTSTVNLDDTATLLEPCSSIFSESFNSTLTSIKDSGVDMKESSMKPGPTNASRVEEESFSSRSEGVSYRHKYFDSFNQTGDTTSSYGEMSFGICLTQDIGVTDLMTKTKDVTDHPLYNWKRVEIFKRDVTPEKSNTPMTNKSPDSKVSSAIQKFEKVCNKNDDFEINCNESRRQLRSRSATGPRIKSDKTFIKALQPRVKAENLTEKKWSNNNNSLYSYGQKTLDFQKDCSTGDLSVSSINNGNTESDLNKICSRNSRKNIRHAWRHRRSVSMTPKVSVSRAKTGPVFGYIESFTIPSHGSKCHISGIIVLANGFVVALDEIHCYVVLFDSKRKYLSQYNIMDVPAGLTTICGQSFAISYPFRSKIGGFREHAGSIISDKAITVPCKEWITDIAFQQNTYYTLCKGGHIHVLDKSGSEIKRIIVGVNGKITVNPSAKRIYITGAGQVTRFDFDGNELSRKTNVNTFNIILVGETVYIGDRDQHRIVNLSGNSDLNHLTCDKIDFPSAFCIHREFLFASSFEENMNVEWTRKIRVYQLRK